MVGGGAVGGDAARALRARRVDQGDRAADGVDREHDPAGVAVGRSRRAIGGARRASKLDPFKDEIHRLLGSDPRLPGQRVRELIAPLGFDGGKTIVDDYLREVRPLFRPRRGRFSARSIGRARSASSICGSRSGRDPGRPRPDPPGLGRGRRAWATRAPAPARWSSPRRRRTCCPAIRRCLWSLGALPQTLVWDREAGLHAGGGRPTEEFAGVLRRSCGSAGTSASRADPQAKGVVERLQGFMRDELRARAGAFANELDFQLQLDAWFDERANARMHRTLRCRPDRPAGRGARGDGAAARRRRPTSTGAGCSRVPPDPLPALRHQRLLARPAARRPPRRGPRHRARGHRGRAGHRRARLPARRGRSPGTARSPRSSTPARCSSAATARAARARRSRSGRSPATTR